MSKLVDLTQDWQSLVDYVTSAGGHVGPITLKDVPGAGRGLFLTEDIEAYTSLVSIPKLALLNWNTVSGYYPRLKLNTDGANRTRNHSKPRTLNSTQALTMHLYLLQRSESPAELDPYTSSLPKSFDEHPLTWVGSPREALIDSLPPSTQTALKDVENRCKVDWKAVQAVLKAQSIAISSMNSSGFNPSNGSNHDYRIFVWAWLCVNTRCIHYSLSQSDISRSLKDVDLTLCPIIDFANHSLTRSCSFTVRRDTNDSSLNLEAPAFPMTKGSEVFFHYNAHSNTTLLSEYGFVIPRTPNATEDDEPQEGGEVNIDYLMEALFEGDQNQWKREVLESSGYWGDWTLHSAPPPAHPSYRVITTLRLLHVSHGESNLWEDMIFGGRDIINDTNEKRMRETVRSICVRLVDRASDELAKIDGRWDQRESTLDSFTCYVLECVRILWKEEQNVAVGVIESIDRNEEF